MPTSYLVSTNRNQGEASDHALQALLMELETQGVFPQRIDSRHRPPRWATLTLEESQVATLRARYPLLIFGLDSSLSF